MVEKDPRNAERGTTRRWLGCCCCYCSIRPRRFTSSLACARGADAPTLDVRAGRCLPRTPNAMVGILGRYISAPEGETAHHLLRKQDGLSSSSRAAPRWCSHRLQRPNAEFHEDAGKWQVNWEFLFLFQKFSFYSKCVRPLRLLQTDGCSFLVVDGLVLQQSFSLVSCVCV